MVLPRPYQYEEESVLRPEGVNRLPGLKMIDDPNPLMRVVQGKRASDLEERFARALYKADLPFEFQVWIWVRGGHKRLDFLVHHGLIYPVEVDGVIAHRTSAQQGNDIVREALLNEAFLRRGWMALRRVSWRQLDTQSAADRVVRELFS